MIRAVKVRATENFYILVNLEDGRTIKFDMQFIHKEVGPVVDPLKTPEGFLKAFVRNGVITWPSGYDIDPYFLIESGVSVEKTA